MSYSYLKSSVGEEEIALLQLSLCEGIGPRLSHQLLEIFGSAVDLFNCIKSLKTGPMPNSLAGLSPTKLLQLQQAASFTEAKDLIRLHEKLGIDMVSINQQHYPTKLKEHPGTPLVLFFLGNANWEADQSISIVGTRKPTQRGLTITQTIISDLKAHLNGSTLTVSGLALGIDAMAHQTSLEVQIPTVAILAHGLEQVYPRNHKKLVQQIIHQGGAILSEHPAYTKMHPTLFARRNRLVAGLADALLIIESGTTGGSMVTAGIACHLNKEVFAIPGHPADPQSVGCNSLIQECMAHLCTGAMDIIDKMNWNTRPRNNTKHSVNKTNSIHEELSPDTSTFQTNNKPNEILRLIQQGKNKTQEISNELPHWSLAEIGIILCQLQIEGRIVKELNQEFRIL